MSGMTSENGKFGEFELIGAIARNEKSSSRDLLCGIGDDCAIIDNHDGSDWLVTTDALIEGIHFRREWCDFRSLGRKALNVNLSDIAAMGGRPRFYLVTLGIPKNIDFDDAMLLYEGMRDAADPSEMVLIGGDTTASPDNLCISITVIGDVGHGKALLRNGAKPGDSIYVTGRLGGSALGLHCLESGKACLPVGKAGSEHRRFIDRHLNPVPRIQTGGWLSENGFATSMIDVSDGLVGDLGHIADGSGVGFEIKASDVLPFEGLVDAANSMGLDPLELALTGGEEYELLFTVGGEAEKSLLKSIEGSRPGIDFTRIGKILGDPGRRIVIDDRGSEVRFMREGFDHLK